MYSDTIMYMFAYFTGRDLVPVDYLVLPVHAQASGPWRAPWTGPLLVGC